jgi:hypothetical protein
VPESRLSTIEHCSLSKLTDFEVFVRIAPARDLLAGFISAHLPTAIADSPMAVRGACFPATTPVLQVVPDVVAHQLVLVHADLSYISQPLESSPLPFEPSVTSSSVSADAEKREIDRPDEVTDNTGRRCCD